MFNGIIIIYVLEVYGVTDVADNGDDNNNRTKKKKQWHEQRHPT